MNRSKQPIKTKEVPTLQILQWSDDCSVHIPQLDGQHRKIIELLGNVRKSVGSGQSDIDIRAPFDGRKSYSERHLQREELVLRVRRFPGYAAHKAEHDAYRRKVAYFQSRLDRRDIGIRIAIFLQISGGTIF